MAPAAPDGTAPEPSEVGGGGSLSLDCADAHFAGAPARRASITAPMRDEVLRPRRAGRRVDDVTCARSFTRPRGTQVKKRVARAAARADLRERLGYIGPRSIR